LMGGIALCALTVIRLVIPLTPYEEKQLVGFSISKAFEYGIAGPQLVGLLCAFVAAGLILFREPLRNSTRLPLDLLSAVSILAAGVVLTAWAINPAAWSGEMESRFWMVPMSLLMMGACALDAWFNAPSAASLHRRQLLLLPTGAVFLIVLSVQSLVWNQLTNRLLADLSDGCYSRESIAWTLQTAMDHWSIAAYVIDLQGRTPNRLLLDAGACSEFAFDGTLHIIWMHRKRGEGWFDFDEVPIERARPPWQR
ncbi:MAG TPA: hypothetical protein VMT64_08845, partial [Candidatus Binataceae bacterium]|nr:hypothetical protein [Candidatus Binataceae bacterium]